ncbi:glycoside hydrolase family 127 protein [Candidatus Woesearchaeota archaeon]|nr:glycoside hydrolase family 127 protein [Candidatus Woesearchaeota archaeon]
MALKKYAKYGFSLLARGSLFYFSKEILKDSLNIKNGIYNNEKHIKAAVDWILEAQKANNNGGVAALYSLSDGWHESYSETTGYIIPTMFNYYHKTKEKQIKKSAIVMADWELTKQMPKGAFPGGAVNGKEFPIVFNTGQVIFGMVRTFQETKNIKYKQAAIKAADWLVKVQGKNGCWDKFDYLNKIHTYNTRTAWALLKVYEITKNKIYLNAAKRNIDWVLTRQLENGWFENNAFYETQEPLLHTIAYTIQGILEVGIYLNNKKYINSAEKSSNQLIKLQRKDGSLAGSFDKNWKSSVSWSCLTGNSQMAIVWLRFYTLTKNREYLEAAKRINNYVKSTQDLKSGNKGIRGGIKGAYPVYGWYAPFCYINWAAKFFIDALMMEDDLKFGDKLG